jgi:protein-S-isoprenylcysteine O-methyltransferase Ste14
VFVAILRLRFIRHEERLMETTFGAAYLAYRQRVRRWL